MALPIAEQGEAKLPEERQLRVEVPPPERWALEAMAAIMAEAVAVVIMEAVVELERSFAARVAEVEGEAVMQDPSLPGWFIQQVLNRATVR